MLFQYKFSPGKYVNVYFQLRLGIFGGHFEAIITVPLSVLYFSGIDFKSNCLEKIKTFL
jgi:hypothetical protein